MYPHTLCDEQVDITHVSSSMVVYLQFVLWQKMTQQLGFLRKSSQRILMAVLHQLVG